MKSFEIFSEPRKIYSRMIKDIREARKYVFLETYIYDRDRIGRTFRDELIKKAREGVDVRVLVDAWGSASVKSGFFDRLVKCGGIVRFFRDLIYTVRWFSKNHERNHRKLIVIDDSVSYLGSSNITASGLDWRELVLRLEGEISGHFREAFLQNWDSGKITGRRLKRILHRGFEIIQERPSKITRLTEKKYAGLVRGARKEIRIENPYFVPSFKIRRELVKAVRRGVKVKIILPFVSDVRIIDLVRNRYLSFLYKRGIEIYYYKKILHSKLLIVDDKFFLLGSSNLDYRSFVHQYDINIVGRDKRIISSLTKFFDSGLKQCKGFNYSEWKSRNSFGKILEMFLSFVRDYL
jgi:cardiolipin synthase